MMPEKVDEPLKISALFGRLFDNYGEQGWWPTFNEAGEIEYHIKNPGQAFSDSEKFEVIVGAILTQSSSWKNVETSLFELRAKNLLSYYAILSCNQAILEKAVKSSGYFRQKAKKLKSFCKFLSKNPICELEKLETSRLRELLLQQYGVGNETADSIVLYAFSKPAFVIDAYTFRICSRLGMLERNGKKIDDDFFEKKE